MTPVRIQRSRAKGSKLTSPNGLPVVCVSRGTKLGNPFRVGMSAWEATQAGLKAFGVRIDFEDGVYSVEEAVETYRWCAAKFMRAEVAKVRGCNLACWCTLCPKHAVKGKPLNEPCADCKPCHADPIGEMANAPRPPRQGGDAVSTLKRKSRKQRVKDREWSKIVKACLAEDGQCKAAVVECSGPATDGHHLLKRSRGGLNVRANCLLVCRACHGWLETHDEQARAMGFSFKRHEASVEIGGTRELLAEQK